MTKHNKEKLRQAFETEHEVIPKLPLERLPSGRYVHSEVEEAWQWFQAGFEASNGVEKLAKGCSDFLMAIDGFLEQLAMDSDYDIEINTMRHNVFNFNNTLAHILKDSEQGD